MRKYEREKSVIDKYDREKKIRRFSVVVAAKDLAVHTIQITSNENFFPRRYRLTFTNKMIDKALSIVTLLTEANEIIPSTQKEYELRCCYQKNALAAYKSLEVMIDISKRLFNLPDRKIEYWSKLLFKARNAAVEWYQGDRKRFGFKYRETI